VLSTHFARETAGASSARHSPRPHLWAENSCTTRAHCVAGMRRCGCEPRAGFTSPRLGGEVRGGAQRRIGVRGTSTSSTLSRIPLTRSQDTRDLSPQAGRGDDAFGCHHNRNDATRGCLKLYRRLLIRPRRWDDCGIDTSLSTTTSVRGRWRLPLIGSCGRRLP
jgi:hypothetical protein